MAAGDTLAANVAEDTQEMIDAVVTLMPQTAPALNLFERIEIPKGNNSVEIPRMNTTFTVQTPTEGDELVSGQQLDLTSTTISPVLRAQLLRISGRAEYFSKESIQALVVKEMARSQGQDIDTDITAEFANLGLTAGTTNTDITIAVLRESRRKLQANAVANGGPVDDLVTVLSPIVVENLLTNLGLQGAVSSATTSVTAGNSFIPDGLSEKFIRQYMTAGADLVGVPTFWDGYMTENGSGDYICAMASRKAIQTVYSKNWSMDTFKESNWIGVILRAVADYNTGVGKFANWGVAITADGA